MKLISNPHIDNWFQNEIAKALGPIQFSQILLNIMSSKPFHPFSIWYKYLYFQKKLLRDVIELSRKKDIKENMSFIILK